MDQLPNVRGDGNFQREVVPVLVFDENGLVVDPLVGKASVGNSSQTLLAGDGEFTGAWEVNAFDHVILNLFTDQPGQVFVDFGIPVDGADPAALTDADVIQTFTTGATVYANSGYFRTLIKGAGRAFRVRYVNDATPQTSFALFTAYGNNLFPPSTSPDNELLITTKESLRGHFFAVGAAGITADTYQIAIDLSDTTNYPHDNDGFVVLTSAFLTVDKDSNAAGTVRMGVITRVDATSADVEFVQGFSFERASDTSIVRDRNFGTNRINCRVENGTLAEVASSFRQANITAINTLTPLPNAVGGTSVPAVGDIVSQFSNTSGGAFNPATSGFYFTERA